jgi:hypothetical protein
VSSSRECDSISTARCTCRTAACDLHFPRARVAKVAGSPALHAGIWIVRGAAEGKRCRVVCGEMPARGLPLQHV